MSKLYIANCTRQNFNCQYRLDFTAKGDPVPQGRFHMARSQVIPPGRQVALGGDLHMSQIEDIIEQLKIYGMIGVSDVSNLRHEKAPYVFNVDVPVAANTIRRVVDHNDGIMIVDGRERRQKSAVVVNELVANKVNEPQKLEVEFEQLQQSEAGEKTIGEGYRIDNTAPLPPSKGQRTGRAKRAA